jgi:hypothetical protein
MDFSIIQGDIAAQQADALVNAAGTSLRMGSGVAGALQRGAAGPINEDAMSKGPVDLGEVAVTDAYDLDADYVIHAAAMGRRPKRAFGRRHGTRLKKPMNSIVSRYYTHCWEPVSRASSSRPEPNSSVRRSASTSPRH